MKTLLIIVFLSFSFIAKSQEDYNSNTRSEADEYKNYDEKLGNSQGNIEYQNRKSLGKQVWSSDDNKKLDPQEKVKIKKFNNFLKGLKNDKQDPPPEN